MLPYHERLFSDDYAAGGQLAWATESDDEPLDDAVSWRRAYLGALRFDSLLSRELVVPDSHLFDGRFFLSQAPTVLQEEVGRPFGSSTVAAARKLPLLLALRGTARVDEALATFLEKPDGGLNRFEFKTVPASIRKALSEEIAAHTRDELRRHVTRATNAAAGVASFLRHCLTRIDCDDPAESIDPLEAGWQAWLKFDRASVDVRSYDARTFDLLAAAREEDVAREEFETRIGTSAWQAMLELFAADHNRRSEASKRMNELEAAAASEAERRDLARVQKVISRSRYRAIALQHDATFVRTDWGGVPAGSAERIIERVEKIADPPVGREFPLPTEVTQRLGNLDADAFSRYLTTNRSSLESWWATGDLNDFGRAMEGLESTLGGSPGADSGGMRILVGPGSGLGAGVTADLLHASRLATAGIVFLVSSAAVAVSAAVRRVRDADTRAVRRRIAEVRRGLDDPVVTRPRRGPR